MSVDTISHTERPSESTPETSRSSPPKEGKAGRIAARIRKLLGIEEDNQKIFQKLSDGEGLDRSKTAGWRNVKARAGWRFRRRKEGANSSREDHTAPETLQGIKNFVDQGLDLLKEGKYENAMQYFKGEVGSTTFGVKNMLSKSVTYTALENNDQLKAIMHNVVAHSWYRNDGELGMEIVDVADVSSVLGTQGKINVDLKQKLFFNAALHGAEMWLRVLQMKGGTRVAGQTDQDADIAAYFYNKGIFSQTNFMKDDFLNRASSRVEWYKQVSNPPGKT